MVRTILTGLLLLAGAAGSSHAADYWVVTKTGDKKGAGTDGFVHIKIIGAEGKATDWLALDNKGDDLEQGMADIFHLTGVDVGQVKKIQLRVREEKAQNSPDWYLERISVRKGDLPAELKTLLGEGKAVPQPKVRQQFEAAFVKVKDTKVFEHNAWIHPAKYADSDKPKEWTVVELK